MKSINVSTIALILFAPFIFHSCKKNNNSPIAANRNIKYEITGNFTGKLTVVYSDNVNGNTTVNDVTLPWSKEVNYPLTVMAVGIAAQASSMGNTGQIATIKIYLANTVVKTASATAGTQGEIVLPPIAYAF